jgi:hypothetical protein
MFHIFDYFRVVKSIEAVNPFSGERVHDLVLLAIRGDHDACAIRAELHAGATNPIFHWKIKS